MITNERIQSILDRMGESFLGNMMLLTDAMGVDHRQLAGCLSTGRHYAFLNMLVHRISTALHRSCLEEFAPLLEQAREYILPQRLRKDAAALRSRLLREYFAQRRPACMTPSKLITPPEKKFTPEALFVFVRNFFCSDSASLSCIMKS